MPRPDPLLAAALLLSLSIAPAHAMRAPGSPPEESGRSRAPQRSAAAERALERGPAWSAFRARHGAWRAQWNERAGTPHLAAGPAIALEGAPRERDAIERALRSFVAGNPGVFGGTAPADLETRRVQHAGRVWYASFRRRVRDIPVLFEDWEFRVSEAGRLMAFGADANAAPASLDPSPRLDAPAARTAARAALGLPPEARVEGGDALYWLPAAEEIPPTLHLVREVEAGTDAPPGRWVVLVDAMDGTVRWRHDRVRYDVVGGVLGSVHLNLPTGVPELWPFAHQQVTVGGNVVFSDAGGLYDSPASGTVTVTTGISGSFCDVHRSDGPDAAFSTTVPDGSLAHVTWDDSDSQPGERDAYYHVNLEHDHIRALDPGFVGNDYPMPCWVRIIEASCNAYWDGQGVNFYAAGGGCPDIATLPDVVYHEYGHGVNDNLYIQAGSPFGMLNGALHEGLADVAAAFLQDDPVEGKGFFGPGTALRTLANTDRWPENGDPDPHVTGLIVGGAMWDLRQAIGLDTAERLGHFAKYGLPDDADDGIAMGEYFVQLLVADDDNGNLADGTPHGSAIVAAFNAHGIGTGNFITIGHTALEDQPVPGPYTVIAQIGYSNPFASLSPSGLKVYYSVNGGPYGSVPLVSSGVDYVASIPAPAGTIVRYYLSVTDPYGDTRTLPADPAAKAFTFLAGSTLTLMIHDHESNAGWIPSDASDDATTGRWQWVVPMGTSIGDEPVQTDQDHTPYGILCYVTQNPFIDLSPGASDVDDGHTTLYTSTFDATIAGSDPLIEYYRWYTNDLGNAPGNDFWRVDLSNDGGMSWVPVENTTASANSWERVVFFVRDHLAPTPLMRLRFIAEDVGSPSLVEAAVDDLRLLRFEGSLTAVEGPETGWRLALRPPSPNPSADRTRFDFTLAERGRVSLALYDVAGRRVRLLRQDVLEPGAHDAVWDGRDDRGQRVAGGLYFARLEAQGRVATRRVVRSP